ncbi:hypothetical protein RRG08_019456, partial [Elysia crispata]
QSRIGGEKKRSEESTNVSILSLNRRRNTVLVQCDTELKRISSTHVWVKNSLGEDSSPGHTVILFFFYERGALGFFLR